MPIEERKITTFVAVCDVCNEPALDMWFGSEEELRDELLPDWYEGVIIQEMEDGDRRFICPKCWEYCMECEEPTETTLLNEELICSNCSGPIEIIEILN